MFSAEKAIDVNSCGSMSGCLVARRALQPAATLYLLVIWMVDVILNVYLTQCAEYMLSNSVFIQIYY